MAVYFTMCLTSIVLTWFVTNIKHGRESLLYWLLISLATSFPLIFISGIRYDVGSDYMAYYRYYTDILEGAQQGRFEILYYYANIIVAAMRLQPVWLFSFTAVLFMLPVYKRILADSPYPYISIFLLFAMGYFFCFLNLTRQMIGAAYLFLSVPYIEKKKFIPFLLLVLIATGFHTMCISFLAVYFLASMNLKPKTLLGITIIIYVLEEYIGCVANSIMGGLDYYSGYLKSHFAERSRGWFMLAIDITLLLFATVFYQNDNNRFKAYYNLQVIALWASILTSKVVLIERFRVLFGLPSIVLVPLTLKGIKCKNTRIVCTAAILFLYLLYAVYTLKKHNTNGVLPYKTVFSVL